MNWEDRVHIIKNSEFDHMVHSVPVVKQLDRAICTMLTQYILNFDRWNS